MSRIEELPDDFEEAMKINDSTEWTAEDEMAYREIYRNPGEKIGPAPESSSTKSFEEVLSEISQTPLFMNNLASAGREGMTNSVLRVTCVED